MSALKCESGVPHKWEYRGQASQLYACTACGEQVNKSLLRQLTSPSPAEEMQALRRLLEEALAELNTIKAAAKDPNDPTDLATIAAATAVLDYDLVQAKRTRQAPNDRALTGLALGGSAAVGDCAVDVFIDTAYVGRFYNTRTGFPNNDDLLVMDNLYWPAGGILTAVVVDAPATSPMNFMYSWIDL